jgi:hypothetical protein
MIPIPQAMTMELRLNGGRFGLSMALCALSVVLAATVTDALASVLPLWAALAWYRYGRADTAERAELRALLGLSRADRVRGRVALIGLETLILLLATVLAPLAATATGLGVSVTPGPTFTLSGPPGLPGVLLALTGTLQAALVLTLTAIAAGGDCVVRRPARSMAVLSIVVYLGAGLLSSMLIGVPLVAAELSSSAATTQLLVSAGVAGLLAVTLLVLRRRVRAWIDRLDSGAPARALVGA